MPLVSERDREGNLPLFEVAAIIEGLPSRIGGYWSVEKRDRRTSGNGVELTVPVAVSVAASDTSGEAAFERLVDDDVIVAVPVAVEANDPRWLRKATLRRAVHRDK